MIDAAEEKKTISVSQFKTHCTEELRDVEERGVILQITRHGKIVATVSPPKPDSPALAEWIGAGEHLCKAPDEVIASLDEPTWQPGDWNMESEDEPL